MKTLILVLLLSNALSAQTFSQNHVKLEIRGNQIKYTHGERSIGFDVQKVQKDELGTTYFGLINGKIISITARPKDDYIIVSSSFTNQKIILYEN